MKEMRHFDDDHKTWLILEERELHARSLFLRHFFNEMDEIKLVFQGFDVILISNRIILWWTKFLIAKNYF